MAFRDSLRLLQLLSIGQPGIDWRWLRREGVGHLPHPSLRVSDLTPALAAAGWIDIPELMTTEAGELVQHWIGHAQSCRGHDEASVPGPIIQGWSSTAALELLARAA